jgi:hypothetical protein
MREMYLVSSRRDFWSALKFSEADEVRPADLETGATGPAVTHQELAARLAGKAVLLLVHGYNNDRRDVLAAYAQLDLEYRRLGFVGGAGAPYDAVVGYLWPGGSIAASFFTARARAGDTAPRFARLLQHLATARALDVNTHSLGAHVMLEALEDGGEGAVRCAWNFASAVDNESIEKGERYHRASRACGRFYVFHSKHDPVLRTWYRIGDLPEFDSALGLDGPEDPFDIVTHSRHVRVVNCKDVVTSHGGYRSSGEVYAFMKQELEAPAPEQFFLLERTAAIIDATFAAAGGRRKPPGRPRARA